LGFVTGKQKDIDLSHDEKKNTTSTSEGAKGGKPCSRCQKKKKKEKVRGEGIN